MKMEKQSETITRDDLQLQELGHKRELDRNFSFLSLLGLSFTLLNTWTALSISISVALPSGGPVSVLWGLVTSTLGSLCLSLSLAEFLSAYPTAGGQYHWVSCICSPWCRRFVTWVTGWVNTGGWTMLSACSGLLSSEMIIGLIALQNPSYDPKRWHQFLIYLVYSFLGYFGNAFATPWIPYTNKIGLYWSIIGFITTMIVLLATAAPDYADASWVFGEFINDTGWPDGIAWLLGLLQGSFALTAFDSVVHMIEELPRANVQGPNVMVSAIVVGAVTGFVFLVVLLFVSGGAVNAQSIIEAVETPMIKVMYIATKNRAGTICLTIFPLGCILFGTLSGFAASSRMTYAFARDRGLPFSSYFATIHPRLILPLNALNLTMAVVIVFDLIFLGSTTAFNAITSASVVALNLSYGIPILVRCLQGRPKLPYAVFRIPTALGWIIDLFGLSYVIVTSVLFLFPPSVPATGSSMNYAIVPLTILFLLCIIQWFIKGRDDFEGPQVHSIGVLQDNPEDELKKIDSQLYGKEDAMVERDDYNSS